MKAHLQEMWDIGATRRSNSPWTSMVVLVWKEDGSLRFCIDLRKMNDWPAKLSICYPILMRPSIACRECNGSTLFDLKSGYWQVKMDKESKLLIMFTVEPLGFYKCNVMPFGLTNAPVISQQLMETCLWDLNLKWCIIYLDDIVIFLKDIASHHERLEAMFQKLEQAGLKFKSSKYELFQWQITYLGHIVSAQGIATNKSKIEAITKSPTPINVM